MAGGASRPKGSEQKNGPVRAWRSVRRHGEVEAGFGDEAVVAGGVPVQSLADASFDVDEAFSVTELLSPDQFLGSLEAKTAQTVTGRK